MFSLTILSPSFSEIKKPGAIDKDSAKEKPPKQNQRTHSDVANESAEGVDMIGIQSDLSEIKQSLRGTVTKSDLKGASSGRFHYIKLYHVHHAQVDFIK
jgi:hypothetical protein